MPKKMTNEEFKKRLESLQNGIYTNDEYINPDAYMKYYCKYGHSWDAQSRNILWGEHSGCPYCSGLKPWMGETDMWTTDPYTASLLLDKNDGYTHTCCSSDKTWFVCPDCGAHIVSCIGQVHQRGLSCNVCGDNWSFPNKFMASVLEQLKIAYSREYSFIKSKYRYDFYISDFSMIIEMNGRQHYEEWNMGRISLIETQQNDLKKKQFAIDHGVTNYIIIDCRRDDRHGIQEQIINSELSKMICFDEVNWKQCEINARSSNMIKSINLYNNGKTTAQIAKTLNYSESSILNWLRCGNKLGLCIYIPNEGFLNAKHSVILLNTKEVFNSLSSASKRHHVAVANISKVCLKQRTYAGIHQETGEPMVWRYVEDYDENEVFDFMSLLNLRVNYTADSTQPDFITQQNNFPSRKES